MEYNLSSEVRQRLQACIEQEAPHGPLRGCSYKISTSSMETDGDSLWQMDLNKTGDNATLTVAERLPHQNETQTVYRAPADLLEQVATLADREHYTALAALSSIKGDNYENKRRYMEAAEKADIYLDFDDSALGGKACSTVILHLPVLEPLGLAGPVLALRELLQNAAQSTSVISEREIPRPTFPSPTQTMTTPVESEAAKALRAKKEPVGLLLRCAYVASSGGMMINSDTLFRLEATRRDGKVFLTRTKKEAFQNPTVANFEATDDVLETMRRFLEEENLPALAKLPYIPPMFTVADYSSSAAISFSVQSSVPGTPPAIPVSISVSVLEQHGLKRLAEAFLGILNEAIGHATPLSAEKANEEIHWTCAVCGKNDNKNQFCAACGAPKSLEGAETTQDPSPLKAAFSEEQAPVVCKNCGTVNYGWYCPGCGKIKEADPPPWTCRICGATDNRGAYCRECGAKASDCSNEKSWFCPNCGNKNKSAFCMNCGRKRPE